MMNKIFGFEEAWNRMNKIFVWIIVLLVGLIWVSYIFSEKIKCETQEI